MIFCSEYTQWKKNIFGDFTDREIGLILDHPLKFLCLRPGISRCTYRRLPKLCQSLFVLTEFQLQHPSWSPRSVHFYNFYLQLRQFFPPAKQTSGRSEVCWSSPCSPCTLWRPWPCTSCTSHPAIAWRPMRSWWFGSSELRVERFATRCWWCCAAFRGPGSIPRWAMVCWISYIIGTLW